MELLKALTILGITSFISGCLGLLLPFFMDYKGFSVAEIGIVLAAASITSIAAKLSSGYIADRIGIKKPLVTSLILGVVSIFLILYVKSSFDFSLLRLLFGVSLGISGTTLGSLVANIGKDDLSATMGKYTMVVAVASTIVGPSSAGFLATYLGFSNSFVFLTALFLFSLALSLSVQGVKLNEQTQKQRFELDRQIFFGSSFQIMAMFLVTIMVSYLSLYTARVYSKILASTTALIAGVPFLFAPKFGKLADRFGRDKMIATGFFLYSFSLLLFKLSFALPVVLSAAFVSGLGGAVSAPSIWALALSGQRRGTRMGIMQALSEVGVMIGNSAGGFMAQTLGFINTFFLSGLIGLLPIALTRFIKQKKD